MGSYAPNYGQGVGPVASGSDLFNRQASQPGARQDQFDAAGRFIGRTGGVAGVDYGVGDQNNDKLGEGFGNFGRLVNLMNQGYTNPTSGQQLSGLQALSEQAMGHLNAGASTMGTGTSYGQPAPAAPAAPESSGRQWGGADIAQNAQTFGSDFAGRAAQHFYTGQASDAGTFGK
jgi:hypothetical protein